MRRIFGTEFKDYEKNVPLFVPRLTAWQATHVTFDSKLYLRYREYQAAMGAVAAMAVLAAKAYYFG
jgi:hypothetical protein